MEREPLLRHPCGQVPSDALAEKSDESMDIFIEFLHNMI